MNNNLSVKMSESIISGFKPGMMQWHYQDGLIVRAIYEIGKYYGRNDFIQWAIAMYDALIDEDGNISTYKKEEFNLDQINPGRVLFELYNETKNEKYLKAIRILQKQLEEHPRTKNGLYWHKKIYPWQVWLDGLYMEGPFSTKSGHFEDVSEQLIKVAKVLNDEETGLLYHAWDESKSMPWANKENGLSPNFWSRSIGWYLMACVDCLELAPEGYDDKKKEIMDIVSALLDSVYSFQDNSGMWFQIPNRATDKGNYLETSGSAMFCYTAFKAAKYTDEAIKGLEGICSKYLSNENGVYHLGGICSVAGLGGNPYRDGSTDYYYSEPVVVDDFKGTGPFILACLEYEKMINKK